MLPNGRAQPAAREKPSWGSRVLRWVGKAPLYVKLIILVAAVFASPFILLYVLGSAVIDVVQKRPGRLAAYAVATWAIPVDIFSQVPRLQMLPLLVLPFVVAWAARHGPAGPLVPAVPHHGVGHAVVAADRDRPAQVLADRADGRRGRGLFSSRSPWSAGGWRRECRTPACTRPGLAPPVPPGRLRSRPGRLRSGSGLRGSWSPAPRRPAGLRRPGSGRGAALR